MCACLGLEVRVIRVYLEQLSDTSVSISTLLMFLPIILELVIRASRLACRYSVDGNVASEPQPIRSLLAILVTLGESQDEKVLLQSVAADTQFALLRISRLSVLDTAGYIRAEQ